MENVDNKERGFTNDHPIVLRPSPAIVILWVILLSFLFNIIYFLVMVFEPIREGIVEIFKEDSLIILFFGAIQIIFSIVIFFRWQHEYYEIHPGVIFHHRGYFHTKMQRILTADSESVTYSQTSWGKMLKYGDIIIQFPSSSVTLPRVENPTYALHSIREATSGEMIVEREQHLIESDGESN